MMDCCSSRRPWLTCRDTGSVNQSQSRAEPVLSQSVTVLGRTGSQSVSHSPGRTGSQSVSHSPGRTATARFDHFLVLLRKNRFSLLSLFRKLSYSAPPHVPLSPLQGRDARLCAIRNRVKCAVQSKLTKLVKLTIMSFLEHMTLSYPYPNPTNTTISISTLPLPHL